MYFTDESCKETAIIISLTITLFIWCSDYEVIWFFLVNLLFVDNLYYRHILFEISTNKGQLHFNAVVLN